MAAPNIPAAKVAAMLFEQRPSRQRNANADLDMCQLLIHELSVYIHLAQSQPQDDLDQRFTYKRAQIPTTTLIESRSHYARTATQYATASLRYTCVSHP